MTSPATLIWAILFWIACCTVAYSQSNTTLTVSVNVVQGCTSVSTTALDFGQVTGQTASGTQATGSIQVSCDAGLSYKIALDAGQHYNASTRRMVNGTDFMAYKLYQDANHSIEWGDAELDQTYPAGSVLPDVGTGSEQSHTVFGRIEESASKAGAHSDIVNVTIFY